MKRIEFKFASNHQADVFCCDGFFQVMTVPFPPFSHVISRIWVWGVDNIISIPASISTIHIQHLFQQ